ncbi:MAG: HNH endonuclease signature motif containing protein [Candidatus Zixiibacteriota bacterium]
MRSDGRCVYRFILQLSTNQGESDASSVLPVQRAIPSEIKQTVWKRDHGCCKICGAVDNLHFDHIIPYSKGGTSLSAENVQILCARHNLQKSDKIE